MIRLMIRSNDGAILAASHSEHVFQMPSFAEVVEVPGDVETFVWPHPNGPSACLWDGAGVVSNPAVPQPVDEQSELETAITDATTLEGLKKALLGTAGRAGRIGGRKLN